MVQMKRLETFHQRCLRRILRIKWFHRISNVEVLRRANLDTLKSHVELMRLRWYGHVVRMSADRLPGYLLDWVPKHGKRNRGRPKKSWKQVVEEDFSSVAGIVGAKHSYMRTIAGDREEWRDTITAGNLGVT